MTLGHKMFLSTLALLVSLLVIIAASLLGISGLSRDLDSALVEYGKLEAAYGVGVEVDTVRALLNAGAVDDPSVLPRLASAQTKLRNLRSLADESQDAQELWPEGDPRHPHSILRTVATLVHQARSDPGLAEDRLEVSAGAAKQLGAVLDHIRQVIDRAQKRIERTAVEANTDRDRITTLVVSLSAVLGLAAVVISVGQYRGVMSPMRWLREGVREIAAGQFGKRLETRGDREFVELAQDFNRMASELDGLYRELEEKVRIKSRELVRSERLASVGFLAAGVAHEINNPLGIITGYSELTLRRLEKAGGLMDQTAGPDEPLRATGRRLIDETTKHLTLICEEAFRCKKITQKLLTLARGQVEARAPVAMDKVASHVAEIVRGLPRFRGKEVQAQTPGDPSERLMIFGSETEMKQVLLNLVINALDAVPARSGRVSVAVRRDGAWVEAVVSDNGKGMSRETLDRIFEPFYTQKRQATDGESGTGLGLSITHAIVQDHHGRVAAESDGLGQGSRFTVSLPAYDPPRGPQGVPVPPAALITVSGAQTP